jgi:argininosuccinate lyase
MLACLTSSANVSVSQCLLHAYACVHVIVKLAVVGCHVKLQDLVPRVNTLPLGCGALAGHAFGIDRELLKTELKFGDISLNSMVSISKQFLVYS